jgi:hypothetical protein
MPLKKEEGWSLKKEEGWRRGMAIPAVPESSGSVPR